MLTLTIIFFLSCSIPNTPDLVIPRGTLVLRESLNGPGPERTGNWWGRFDRDGCWWEAHNTWLVVTDSVLSESAAHPLHWNAVEPERPWFCIEEDRLEELKRIVRTLPKGAEGHGYTRPMDRWTVVTSSGSRSHVVYRGAPTGSWKALTDYFDQLASVSIWGLSPEED